MAEWDEIKEGNLYTVRVRLLSDSNYKTFFTEEELRLHENKYLLLGKIEPAQQFGVVGGVSVELSDNAFVAHFMPLNLKAIPGDPSLIWKVSTTTAEFWERFDCVSDG